ncbi:ATP-grasp domain-containing protein [Agrobacterium rosae]|nr:ATP-grasp domain-containing protein [Agrobacterium rosae]
MAVRTLLRSGIELVIVDEPNSPLSSMGDHLIPVESIRDEAAVERAILDYHAALPIDGIITFLDYLLPLVGRLNERLGLRGKTEASAWRCFHKLKQRHALEAAGVPGPAFESVDSLQALYATAEKIKFPFVLKPVDRSASKGVSLVENKDQLEQAMGFALSEGWGGGFIAEAYLDGLEHGVDVMTRNGKSVAIAVSDKTFLPGRFFVRDAHWMPSRLDHNVQTVMSQTAVAAVDALGVNNCITHVQLRLTIEGPKVVEVNGRVTGGFNVDMLERTTGINLYKTELQLVLGDVPDVEPTRSNFASLRELIDGEGRLEAIQLNDLPYSTSHLAVLQTYVEPGDQLEPAVHGNNARGVIMAWGSSQAEVEQEITRLVRQVNFRTSTLE